jgi:PKD repeat protein
MKCQIKRTMAILLVVCYVLSITAASASAAADFTVTRGKDSHTAVFIDTSSGTNVIARSIPDWIFGDGGTSSGSSTTHKYKKAGTYTVTMTIKELIGWKKTTTIVTRVATKNIKIPLKK